jgi:hypothetical protein
MEMNQRPVSDRLKSPPNQKGIERRRLMMGAARWEQEKGVGQSCLCQSFEEKKLRK